MQFPLPEAFTVADYEALQQRLLPLVQCEASGIPVGTLHAVAKIQYMHGMDGSTPGRRQVVVSGPAADCCVRILRWLLDQEPPGRLLACPACGRFFYRHKQQAFCSRRCGNRLGVRQYRARHAQDVSARP
jgi:hypothetical protein